MQKKNITLVVVLGLLALSLALMIGVRFSEKPATENDQSLGQATPTPDAIVMPTPEPTPTPTPTPTPEPTPTPTPEPYWDKPDIDIESWEYLLVNGDNNICAYVPELAEVEYGHQVDERVAQPMKYVIAAARAAGP